MGEKEPVPPKYATEAQLEEFVKVARETIGRMRKDIEALQLRAEEEAKVKYIHCSEKGCSYQTDDLGSLVKHAVDEKMRKLSETAPKDSMTLEELETALIKKGFVKYPEEDICPECGTKLVKPLLEKPHCPKCGWKKPLPSEEF